MMHVLTIKRYLSFDTFKYSSGSCSRIARKKHSSSAEVMGPFAGSLFGKWLKEGQMALIMVETHWPVWYVCVPNQMMATIPRTIELELVWV
jgi:hypothetical protein